MSFALKEADNGQSAKLVALVRDQGETVGVSPEIIAAVTAAMEYAVVRVNRPTHRCMLFDVWNNRGQRHMKRGSPIQGFPELLRHMSESEEESLCIVTGVKNSEGQFLIFVTTSLDRLIGILYYPDRELKEYAQREKADRERYRREVAASLEEREA